MKQTLFILCTLFAFCLSAQMNPHKEKQQMAILKLLPMVGKWQGTAVTQQGPNKMTLTQHENVQLKLDSTILLIEGKGYDEAGTLAFNAIAIISYNGPEDHYEMKSFTDMGLSTEADFELTEEGFNWGFKTPQGQVQYKASLDEKSWVEKGSFSADGSQWFEFVTLELTKLDE